MPVPKKLKNDNSVSGIQNSIWQRQKTMNTLETKTTNSVLNETRKNETCQNASRKELYKKLSSDNYDEELS
jgi:hypothetical protein